MSKPDFIRQKNKWLPKIKAWIEENRPGEKMVFYSATLEAELLAMSEEEKTKIFTKAKECVVGCAFEMTAAAAVGRVESWIQGGKKK